MAKGEETSKTKKPKDKSDKKKKRKHVEEDGSEKHVSSKRSKSASTTLESKHGRRPVKDSSSSPVPHQNGVETALPNGLHGRTEVNGTTEGSTTIIPGHKKKKKKTKSSGTATLEDNEQSRPSTTTQEIPRSSSEREQESQGKSSSTAPAPAFIQNLNGRAIDPLTQDQLSPPTEITSNLPQPIVNVFETPYIEQTLRSILSTALTVGEEDKSKSPFVRQAIQLYLPLSPITLTSALEGVCAEHLSPLLLKYHPPLHGVVLSYAHPRFSSETLNPNPNPKDTDTDMNINANTTTEDTESSNNNKNNKQQHLAISVSEYATPMIWLDVDILLFQPARGQQVEGLIVLQSESHIGLQVYNLFSGRIPRTSLPADWKWSHSQKSRKRRVPSHKGRLKGGEHDGRDEDGLQQQQQQQQPPMDVEMENGHDEMGYWIDGTGAKVEGVLKFWVWEVDIALGGREAERNLPTLEGTLIEEMVLGEGLGDVLQRRRVIKEKKRKG